MINLIVAYDKNKVIGKNNEVPWRLPEDLKFFKDITNNQICLMGRNTWKSLPDKFRPLPNRKNIVVSKQYKHYPDDFLKTIKNLDNFDDVWTTVDVRSALNLCKMNWPKKEIFVIGGEQIYKYFLSNNLIDKMFISEINNTYEGDVYFPDFDVNGWDVQTIRCFDEFNVFKYIKK